MSVKNGRASNAHKHHKGEILTTSRQQVLAELKKDDLFDILVVGGGATGCGVALDAASRGLSVALVEKNDFSEGTSGRSTKLLHGGIRYLESAVRHLDRVQFNLVKDGLRERSLILSIAPHLCHRIPLVTPLYGWVEVPYVYTGLKFYDLMAGKKNIGSSRYLNRSSALRNFPMLRSKGLKGGVKYYDGQFNDARMAVSIALTARAHGAVAANHIEVVGFHKVSGRIAGAVVKDNLDGDSWIIRAKVIVNATGPFADNIRSLDDSRVSPMLEVTSGIHVLLDGRFSPEDTGLLIPRTEDGRVIFVLPWEGSTLVGTTDHPAELSDHPCPTEEEIRYLESYISRYFDLRFTLKDIKASWSGLRPLLFDPSVSDTAKLSRDHIIVQSQSGLVTIAGGKWTTYRKMAEDTVDHVIHRFKLTPLRGCQTERLFIAGGENYDHEGDRKLAEEYDFDENTACHLNRAYGDKCRDVAIIAASGYGVPLSHEKPFLEAEVIYAVRHEMAQRAMDVMARRIPLAQLDTAAAKDAAPRVIELMSSELNWSDTRRADEERDVEKRLREGI
jgi:glycerol-3-phosphate dehydrogenase